MSTNGNIRLLDGDEVILHFYNHWDSYPSGLGNTIVTKFKNESFNNIDELYKAMLEWYGMHTIKMRLNPDITINDNIRENNYIPGSGFECYLYDLELKNNKVYMKVYDLTGVYEGKDKVLIGEEFADKIDINAINKIANPHWYGKETVTIK